VTALPHDATSAIGYGQSATTSTRVRSARRARFRASEVVVERPSAVSAVTQMRSRTFILIVASLLTATLAAVLTINTLLAQGSFARFELRTKDAELVIREQALAAQVAALENPQALAARAHSLGMVPNASPVYINIVTGEVTGEPTPVPMAAAPATLGMRAERDGPADATVTTGPAAPGGETPIGLRAPSGAP